MCGTKFWVFALLYTYIMHPPIPGRQESPVSVTRHLGDGIKLGGGVSIEIIKGPPTPVTPSFSREIQRAEQAPSLCRVGSGGGRYIGMSYTVGKGFKQAKRLTESGQ